MNDSGSASTRLSKNERRAEAREKARQLRAEQQKRERRNRWLLQGGVALAALAIIAVIALVLVNSVRPAGPGPRNMASDGIKIGEGLVAFTTPALSPEATPVESEPNPAGVVDIQIFIDYLCPICAEFEEVNGPIIRTLVESGAATVEYRPIAILINRSAGSQYSLRSANAAACVANYNPDSFFDVNEALFSIQREEGTVGPDDAELLATVRSAGATAPQIEQCIIDRTFKSWVQAATDRATNGPLAIRGAEIDSIAGTPTVLVNGQVFEYRYPFEAGEFQQFVLQAAGDEYSTNPSPSPTPSPTP
ncbi:MAG: thioredoxin domain-containing protein [Microcella sp.]|uniref:DsbA family protein n=1 Tax=Microcella sp. TaxID=1913979 RepID=UPI0024CBD745|nr:thioredoxin domain-containing protein [Microcella sp.]UYN82652.1 MAG: thioredoxin domain-containing protein [Microcella sp.]